MRCSTSHYLQEIRESVINRNRKFLLRPISHSRLNKGNKILPTIVTTESSYTYRYQQQRKGSPANNTSNIVVALIWLVFRKLNNYRTRIYDSITDMRSDCGVTPHDVNHLFSCPANPTDLTSTDLWRKAKEAADLWRHRLYHEHIFSGYQQRSKWGDFVTNPKK